MILNQCLDHRFPLINLPVNAVLDLAPCMLAVAMHHSQSKVNEILIRDRKFFELLQDVTNIYPDVPRPLLWTLSCVSIFILDIIFNFPLLLSTATDDLFSFILLAWNSRYGYALYKFHNRFLGLNYIIFCFYFNFVLRLLCWFSLLRIMEDTPVR